MSYLTRHKERKARELEGDAAAPGLGVEMHPLYLRRFWARHGRVMRTRPSGRDGAVHDRAMRARNEVTGGPVAARAGVANFTRVIDLHLVRHGETQSYLTDAGLTPEGAWQSRSWGHRLSAEVRDGETVRLLYAPSARATRTAEQVRLGLEDGLAARRRNAVVLGPEPAPEFRNFRIWTPSGLLDPTEATGDYRLALERQEPTELQAGRPLWLLELSRFWALQSGGGDPIELWMTSPLLTFEPPAAVVRRLWTGTIELAVNADQHTRVVCCTHSGPMRAFATWALGHDAGEPFNTEQVRVRVWPDLGRAIVTFRGRTQEIDAAPLNDGTLSWELPPSAVPAMGPDLSKGRMRRKR